MFPPPESLDTCILQATAEQKDSESLLSLRDSVCKAGLELIGLCTNKQKVYSFFTRQGRQLFVSPSELHYHQRAERRESWFILAVEYTGEKKYPSPTLGLRRKTEKTAEISLAWNSQQCNSQSTDIQVQNDPEYFKVHSNFDLICSTGTLQK